jgi:hypothetical protein
MEFENYGDVMYIKSEDDYREWIKHTKAKNLIEDVTQRLDEWDKSKIYHLSIDLLLHHIGQEKMLVNGLRSLKIPSGILLNLGQ